MSVAQQEPKSELTSSGVERRTIVLSGVTLRESGSVVVFREALASLEREFGDQFEIVALVKSRELFDTPRVRYIEFPWIVNSWFARLYFEYWLARGISNKLKPKLWLSMHETSPNVSADVRAVYCHNVAELYRATPTEFLLDWRFGMFTLFFRWIHRINIRKNRFVIVQADWIRKIFEFTYGIRNIVVAPPQISAVGVRQNVESSASARPFRFFYPLVPRPYKNVEVCLQAARMLEDSGFNNFELWLTMDGNTNKYASHVAKMFPDVRTVRWLGTVPRQRVMELYAEVDCLLFPSRLEASPLPVGEFKQFGKPMLLADLPYAHESAAGHPEACFFNPSAAERLAELMIKAAKGEPIFERVPELKIDPPYVRNWSELWKLMLE